jgi:tRNA(Arg) A34 adenosine deaminase TadA
MSVAGAELDRLAPPWRAAFEEAWESRRAGNFGIGAVLVDPQSDEIVSRGRNRVAQATSEPGKLSGNFTAHAEMNAPR